MSVTEGFFVRIESEIARLARATAEERKMPLRELVEQALRAYIADTTEPAKRAAAMHAMEEILLDRMDKRLGQHLERVAGLYAAEAFDHAETLSLVKILIALEAKDRATIDKYMNHARKEATTRLKNRTGPVAEFVSQSRTAMEKLQAELKEARNQIAQQRERADIAEKLKNEAEDEVTTLREEALLHRYERARDEWAAQQLESQGMLRRKSFQEWRAEYARYHPAPKAGVI